MTLETHENDIAQMLLELDGEIERELFFPTVEPEASAFALKDPYAFLLAAVIDRGKSEINWTVPYWLYQQWGHLRAEKVNEISDEEIFAAFAALPKLPRFWKQAPETVRALTHLITETYQGDARAVWLGHTPKDVQGILRALPHVGPGIASMTIQLIERVFPDQLLPAGMSDLDIKADVHTRRVLYRLGVAEAPTDAAALQAARRLNPDHPGKLDAALWFTGHRWCHAGKPDCEECFLSGVCTRRIDPSDTGRSRSHGSQACR